jgi:hypothetical protein
MREQLLQFADQFDTDIDQYSTMADERQKLKNPVLFVFLGDLVEEALMEIFSLNASKWRNNAGIYYLHIAQEMKVNHRHVFHMPFNANVRSLETSRVDTFQHFEQDEILIQLNQIIRTAKSAIATSEQTFVDYKHLNVYVVTRVEEPINIILPELTVLIDQIFIEDFHTVKFETMSIIVDDSSQYGLSYANGISFLKELTSYQQDDFRFSKELKMTEQGVKMKAEHHQGPLFDFVYLLSNKLENGQIPANSLQSINELITNLVLMKNKQLDKEITTRDQFYDEETFIKTIRQLKESRRDHQPSFCSVGFTKLKRPNRAIALEVLSQFVIYLKKFMSEEIRESEDFFDWRLLSTTKLNASLPDRNIIDHMISLMHVNRLDFQRLKKSTLREAELELYGDHAAQFFRDNIERKMELLESEIREAILHKLFNQIIPEKGLLNAFEWTKRNSQLNKEIRENTEKTNLMLQSYKNDLAECYNMRVEQLRFVTLPWMHDRNVRAASYALLQQIYFLKYEIFVQSQQIKIYEIVERVMHEVNETIGKVVKEYEKVLSLIQEESRRLYSNEDDDLSRNIPEYYAFVVNQVISKLEEDLGDNFCLQDKYIGNIYQILDRPDGKEIFLDKIISFCREYIFPDQIFHKSFEEELHERSQINVNVLDKNRALTKQELFHDLLTRLKRGVQIRLPLRLRADNDQYLNEMYFIGNKQSEFIEFANQQNEADTQYNKYKLGCVNIQRKTCIEKINLIGGINIDHVSYYVNGLQLYESYIEKGFSFHHQLIDQE